MLIDVERWTVDCTYSSAIMNQDFSNLINPVSQWFHYLAVREVKCETCGDILLIHVRNNRHKLCTSSDHNQSLLITFWQDIAITAELRACA
jgi:hypothetical protein